ncbi:MAG: ABC transporter permease subunit [Erysipelothrix sp.]|nr:ABC transporter permease subunit [Erysipelothrix sp.]
MLQKLFPNLIEYFDEFLISLSETFQMMIIAGSITIIIGLITGVLIVVTKPKGIMENRLAHQIFDKITNLIWSIPFIILYMTLYPLVSYLFKQNALKVTGAILPLVIGAVPFFVRQVENALSEVDQGIIEAAVSMGISNFQIITRVYLKESIPSLARGASITLVVLFGLTTIAGTFGPGGLGIFVKRYGYDRNMLDILYVSVIVIILIVSIIQAIGNYIARKTTH